MRSVIDSVGDSECAISSRRTLNLFDLAGMCEDAFEDVCDEEWYGKMFTGNITLWEISISLIWRSYTTYPLVANLKPRPLHFLDDQVWFCFVLG